LIDEDIELVTKLDPELGHTNADPGQIEQVVMNFAINARDAMPDGGRLTIETANVELDADYVASHGEGTPGPHVMLAISDTGTGMTAEVQRHLFEPFYTTKAIGAGTGLGLATVFGVVKQSGGSIYLYSEEGAGTTFKIYLPAATGPAASAPPSNDRPASVAGSETILVVEDDDGVRELVRLMLEASGYQVVTAAGPQEAEQVCAAGGDGIDLVLTDVVKPGTNGRVLADRLVELCPTTRVLFMSGYSDEAVFHNGVIRPESAFVEKPFTALALTRKVRELLDRPA
jgi:CheY-like chemotaxis protein